MMEKAYFVRNPRTIDDLKQLHPLDRELPYQVNQELVLSKIEYENFITDMKADRLFLEEYTGCRSDELPLQCLFIHTKGAVEGILVLPDDHRRAFVKWAACHIWK